jgi:hypothetical protein
MARRVPDGIRSGSLNRMIRSQSPGAHVVEQPSDRHGSFAVSIRYTVIGGLLSDPLWQVSF